MVKNSCASITRQSTSVITVGVAYVNICISRYLKEEMALVVDQRLWAILVIKCYLKQLYRKEAKE